MAKKPTAKTKPQDGVEGLRSAISEVAARKECDAKELRVQHLLVSFSGSQAPPKKARSKDEAEQLTADLFTQITGGGDFDALVKQHTDDSHPGIYGMTMVGSGDRGTLTFPRKGMVAAFGDVGWRLAVGEVGVAPFDMSKSPFGWHIIKRLS